MLVRLSLIKMDLFLICHKQITVTVYLLTKKSDFCIQRKNIRISTKMKSRVKRKLKESERRNKCRNQWFFKLNKCLKPITFQCSSPSLTLIFRILLKDNLVQNILWNEIFPQKTILDEWGSSLQYILSKPSSFIISETQFLPKSIKE